MKQTLTTIALSPLLLAQGIATRRNTPVLPEPPGAREGTTGNGPALRLLVLGDSATAGVGAPHQDRALLGQLVSQLSAQHRVEWQLLARTGHKTADTLTRLETIDAGPFDVAVISLGVNDVMGLVGRRRWRAQQACLRELLRNRFDVSRIVISGLPPYTVFRRCHNRYAGTSARGRHSSTRTFAPTSRRSRIAGSSACVSPRT